MIASEARPVFEYNGGPDSSDPLRVVEVARPATEGHLAVIGGILPSLSELSAEQVAAHEKSAVMRALLAQEAARHLAGLMPGIDLVYRMRRSAGGNPDVEHLVPRRIALGEAGDPMLNIDPHLLSHGTNGSGQASQLAFSTELAAKTNDLLAFIDSSYEQDHTAYESAEPLPHGEPGTDAMDRIMSGELKARIVYKDADLTVFVDHKPGTKGQLVTAARECVKNWWELPPEVVGKMAITGLYLAWHMQRQPRNGKPGAINNLTAGYQVPHAHELIGENEPHREFMARLSPKSSRMSEDHPSDELDAVRDAMKSDEFIAILGERLQHATGFFAALRASTTQEKLALPA